MIGKTLAHYEIVEKLGEGGMGEVWKARDTTLEREVAIKVLPEIFAKDENRLVRFEREAKLLASLNHPGIAAVHGLHEQEGLRFLAMELVPGEDLSRRLARGPLSIDEALFTGVQIAEALEAAHAQGVIHRDLKPANVILTPDGRAKVLDFGLAKACDGEGPSGSASMSPTMTSAGTVTGMILGTAAYMSPEQARGKALDKRTDVWSFGCLLFECLTGRDLFRGESISDSLGAILHKEPDWSQLPTGTPPTVRLLLRRCLTKDPGKRLHDIADARIELEQAIEDPDATAIGLAADAVAGLDAGQQAAIIRPARRRFLALGIAAGLLAGAAAGWFLRGEPVPAPMRKLDLGVEIDRGTVRDMPAVAIAPDGARVVFAHQGKLWIQALDELEPRPLEETDAATGAFWSPDGEQVGYFSGGKLWRVAATGGRPVAICDLDGEAVGGHGASWGEDGRIIYARGNSSLMEVPALGGEPREFLPLDEGEGDHHEPHVLAGGSGVLFVAHPEGGSANELSLLAEGRRRILLAIDPAQRIWNPFYDPGGHIVFRRSGGDITVGLWALPFSLSSLEVTEEPFLVVPDASPATVSADGTLAFIHRPPIGGSERILWVDRTGRKLEEIGGDRTGAGMPSLSPDGTKLAVMLVDDDGGQFDMWVRDLVRGAETRVTSDEAMELNFLWTPSGEEIVFSRFAESGGIQYFIVAADGSSPARRLGGGFATGLTPDGLAAIVAAQPEGDPSGSTPESPNDLFVTPFDGGERRAIVAGPARESAGRVSPDGKWLAYASNNSGREEVYVTRFPEGSGRWLVSTEGGDDPFWDRRGGRLYFRRDNTLMEVEVGGGDAPALGTPAALFDEAVLAFGNRGFDVSPDGERFVTFERATSVEDEEATGRTGVKIVQNWIREFE